MEQTFVAEFPLAELTEHDENPRRGAVAAITESMEVNGFYGAVVVQASTNRIIVGNHRARVAAALGHTSVPAFVLDVDDDTARRIMLADNRTNDLAGYDEAELAALLQSIEGDLLGTAFTDSDLELLLAKLDAGPVLPPEPKPFIAPPQRVSKGDIWRVGTQTFMCGSCRDPLDVARLLDGAQVNVAFTSPPYADRRRYDPNSDFQPIHPDDYVEWFAPAAQNVQEHLAPDGSWFVNIRSGATNGEDMESYVLDLVLTHARQWGWHWGSEFVWERIGVPKEPIKRFKSAFEMVYHFSIGRWRFRPDNVRHYSAEVPQAQGRGAGDTHWANRQGLPGRGSYFDANPEKADLAYPSNRLPTFQADHEAVGHPAAFPPGLARFFILAYSDPGDVVYDPFVGSGSTLVAAHSAERPGYGMEISAAYCDIILQRLEEIIGEEGKLLDQVSVDA